MFIAIKLVDLNLLGTCQESNCGKYKFVSNVAMATVAFQDGA